MEYVPQPGGAAGDDVDPDMLLITDWLAGDLTPAQVDAVEHRLGEDQAFFDKVVPHVRVWTSPMPVQIRGKRGAMGTDRLD